MLFRYTLLSGVMLAAGIAGAQAQTPFPPAGQAAFPSPGQTFVPGGGGAGMQQQAPQQQQAIPPCIEKFLPLRDDVDKRFSAVKAVLARKPPNAVEACAQLTKFSQAQVAMLKYIQQNNNPSVCPFPPGLAENVKSSNAQTEEVRKQACAAAAAPRSAGPTLSDALSPPPPTRDNTKTGGGTLDSLFGNPIQR